MQIDQDKRTLTGVEIFRAGDYGAKGSYSEADLDSLAALPEGHEPPLTLDHKQEGVAFGWLKKAYRKGERLLADFAEVAPEMLTALSEKRFKKFSVELYSKDKKLRAVTVLGAQVPEVKGLNPSFGEDDRAEFVAFFDGPTLGFGFPSYVPSGDPFPGTHGAIETETRCAEIGGHCHMLYLDAKRSGFTSPPFVQDSITGAWRVDESGHVHQVTRGEVLESTTPFAHVHPFGIYESYSEPKANPVQNSEEPPMADEKQKQTEAPAVTPEQFAETQATLAALKAELAAEKAKNAHGENIRQFSELTASLAGEGKKLVPAAEAALRNLYLFAASSAGVVKFCDGTEASPTADVKALVGLAKAGGLTVDLKSFSEAGEKQPGAEADEAKIQRRTAELFSEAEKSGNKISMTEASKRAIREVKGA